MNMILGVINNIKDYEPWQRIRFRYLQYDNIANSLQIDC
ncbi:hypothetical protein ABH968_001297 [Lysinibacillus sp. RC79]